ncbi:DNA/RNA polymerases superfamily protein [Gossypium australe]|uniref:DNA/RNA polymerases superfamily protein n=1 Tax=Gossypium australe TaxID=47621 RepID=A0A5B6VKP9_9ROSI|nr:DNA/RNA polymerases superfamily protein [Gossypium australe]
MIWAIRQASLKQLHKEVDGLEMNLPIVSTDYTVKVTDPLGQCVLVNQIYKLCPLKVPDYDFPASLMLLPFDDFDLILGMDWLFKHVKEYANVLPEELPGLPQTREVEFVIELMLGITPILIAPYKMAPTELKELKV